VKGGAALGYSFLYNIFDALYQSVAAILLTFCACGVNFKELRNITIRANPVSWFREVTSRQAFSGRVFSGRL